MSTFEIRDNFYLDGEPVREGVALEGLEGEHTLQVFLDS